MPPDFEKRNKQYLIFRLLITLLGFGLVTFYQFWLDPAFRQGSFHSLYAVLGLYLLTGVALFATYPRWKARRWFQRWHVLADFVFQSVLIWSTGGVFSIFNPLLFVTLVAATSVASARGAFVLATIAAMSLTLSMLAQGLGITPASAASVERILAAERSGFVISHLGVSVLALFTICTLGSGFSHGLRRMEDIQSEILENMAEGLIAVDRSGSVLHLNREARSLLGLGRVEAGYDGLTLDSIFPGERHAALRDGFRESRRRRLQVSLGERSTRERPVEVKLSSVSDEAGQPRYRIGLLSDLSLKLLMENAQRRIQKLEDLQMMALGIAHEIRNPLASIRGCVQEIERLVRTSPQASRYMDIVCRESDRLDGILEEFLLYARSEPLHRVPLDLVRVVEEAVLLLKSRPGLGARTFILNLPASHPLVLGDEKRLTQVFLNLGINAIDATSPEAGKISITLQPKRFATVEAMEAGHDLVPGVEVEFNDNGKGIAPADMKRVFTPFFTRKETGTGLGLSIVDRILREHMGVLDVASTAAKGTTFRLWFPVLAAVGEDKGEKEAAGAQGPGVEELELYSHA